jgi:hypothetical protein
MMYGYSERMKKIADALSNSKPANTAYSDAKNRVVDIKKGY